MEASNKKKAGRKPLKDKKITLTIYPRMSQVKAAGGVEKAKKLAMAALPKEVFN